MKKNLLTPFFVLTICFLQSVLTVNAEPSTSEKSDVQYQRFHYGYHPEGKKYQVFLPQPVPKGLYYSTQLKVTANIDDTPKKETVVIMTISKSGNTLPGEWGQAYLLISDHTEAIPKKIDLFKLFDTEIFPLEAQAKLIELKSPDYVFTQPPKNAVKPKEILCRLDDLTGDGILDIWVEIGYAVVVISFQNGEFKEIFNSYTIHGLLPAAEYVDLDDNGTYEIKIPYSIHIAEVPGSPHLPWMSLYEWDGNTYGLNNKKFYVENNEFFIHLLSEYNYQMLQHGRFIKHCETYNFYLGLVYYYRNGASGYLEWILENAKNDNYIQAASSLLNKAP